MILLLSYFYSTLQGSIFYGISGVIERITPFGTRGSLFCTLLVASGFTALEGKKEKNTKIFVIWESDGNFDCYFLFVCLFVLTELLIHGKPIFYPAGGIRFHCSRR